MRWLPLPRTDGPCAALTRTTTTTFPCPNPITSRRQEDWCSVLLPAVSLAHRSLLAFWRPGQVPVSLSLSAGLGATSVVRRRSECDIPPGRGFKRTVVWPEVQWPYRQQARAALGADEP